MSKKKKTTVKGLKSSILSTIYGVFMANPYKAYNFKQLSHVLKIHDKTTRELVRDGLEQLAANLDVVALKRGKYQLNPSRAAALAKKNVITGIVDMKQTGKAYILTKELSEDVYIAPNNTNHALNGDEVKVQLLPKRKGKKTEGRIIEIIKRVKKQFVGIIKASPKYAFLIPDDTSTPVDIFIPLSGLKGAKDGQKAVAVITEWPEHSNNPFGEVIEVLGTPGDHEVEMSSILVSCDFPLSFPPEVLKEADRIAEAIPEHEIRKRRDFRGVFTCTIDPEDAKDFDDALSLKKLPDGNWEVGVHIADVSYYIKPGSEIDKEAFRRATSVYLVDRTFPMLPEKLSNMVCSLRPDEDKLCFSAVFTLNDKGEVMDSWFGRTVIRSARRFNYEEAQEIIETGKGDHHDAILTLNRLAGILRKERYRKGAINFNSAEVKFRLDEQYKPVGIYIKKQMDSNRLIEDFMLLANRRVAELVGKRRKEAAARTFVYRIHDTPDPEKLRTFAEFVGKLGYKIKLDTRAGISKSLNRLFDDIEGKAEENMIENIAVRTMAKAIYSIHNIGHYGLAFPYYTHFTSPIRRYPDLMVHRLLEDHLAGRPSADAEETEYKCQHSSDMERKAQDAERASVKFKQAEFLMDKIGNEFDGVISGVSKWGLYVELDETKCEGLVSIRYFDDDYYYLDDENYCITGQRYGKEYRLGDRLRIRVKGVDLSRKQLDFEPVIP